MAPAALDTVPTPTRIGRYQIVRRIGRGGMAEVFLGRAVGPGGVAKRLCIKRILPGVAVDPRAIERFTEEARTSLDLQHANIVPVFDFGRDGQDLYLAMEWIDGCDLGALLSALRARGDRIPPLVAVHVAGEVASALGYAHGRQPRGVLHRDVTPRNVLLSRLGDVRLADFGISRALGRPGAPTGTPAYMAPEAARGETADERSDLYSLGLVLAEMLAGRRVRSGDSPEAAREPAILPDLSHAPPDLALLAQKLVAPDLASRLSSAAHAERALTAILAAATLRGEAPPRQTLADLVTAIAPATQTESAVPAEIGTVASPTVDAGGTREFAPASPPPAPARRRPRAAVAVLAVGLAGGAAAIAIGIGSGRGSGPTAATTVPHLPPARPAPPPVPTGAPVSMPLPAPPAVAAQTPPPPLTRTHRAGTLKITTPGSWAKIFVDRKYAGEAPREFSVSPGRHKVRAENPALRWKSEDQTVSVAAGETKALVFTPR